MTPDLCPICNGLGFLRTDLPIDHPDFGRLTPCSCQLAELAVRRLSSLRAMSQLSGLDRMTFESTQPVPPDTTGEPFLFRGALTLRLSRTIPLEEPVEHVFEHIHVEEQS